VALQPSDRFAKVFADVLKDARARAELSQKKLAELSGVGAPGSSRSKRVSGSLPSGSASCSPTDWAYAFRRCSPRSSSGWSGRAESDGGNGTADSWLAVKRREGGLAALYRILQSLRRRVQGCTAAPWCPWAKRGLRGDGGGRKLRRMTQKEIVLEAVQKLPDDCSIDEIADRIDFLSAVQTGFDQIDRGEGIPHEEVKKQLASWLTS
jgi:transcriptional regulator with XRE-family HTH domain/predicted transcriptional regulator